MEKSENTALDRATLYYVHIAQTYLHKNKLEAAIYDFLKSIDRVAVPVEEVGQFKEWILAKISILNEKFPRCKPITADFWNSHYGEDGEPSPVENIRTTYNLSLSSNICNLSLRAGRMSSLSYEHRNQISRGVQP